MYIKIEIVPIHQKEAKVFVRKYHRHHTAPRGSVFQIGCAAIYPACSIKNREEITVSEIIGVIMVGRPCSFSIQEKGKADNNWTLEVNRLCVMDGFPNACSMLYAAAWRTAKSLGWKRLITYILKSETGTSLYASGWKCLGERGGGSWSSKVRPRIDKHPTQIKLLFEAA